MSATSISTFPFNANQKFEPQRNSHPKRGQPRGCIISTGIALAIFAVCLGWAAPAIAELVYESEVDTGCLRGSVQIGGDGQLYLLCRDFEVRRYSQDLSISATFVPDSAVDDEHALACQAESLAVRADGYMAVSGYLCERYDEYMEEAPMECAENIPYAAVIDPSGTTVLEYFPQTTSEVASNADLYSVSWQGDDLLAVGDVCLNGNWDECTERRYFAVRLTTAGQEVWNLNLPREDASVERPLIWGAPDDRTAIYYRVRNAEVDGRLIGVGNAGDIEWTHSWPHSFPESIGLMPDGLWIAAGDRLRGIDPVDGDVLWEWEAGPEFEIAPDGSFYTVDYASAQFDLTRRDVAGTPIWQSAITDSESRLAIPPCRGVVYFEEGEPEASVTTHLVNDLGELVDSESYEEPTEWPDEKGYIATSMVAGENGSVFLAATFTLDDTAYTPVAHFYKTYLIRYRLTDDPDASCSGPPPDDDADDDVDDDVADDDAADDDATDDDIGNLANDDVSVSDEDDDGCGW
ncbi:MAG: hypothetical protein IT350_03550 [Deltaproteobacteria bacterium]|nr:hypothetical protein [Deltaproteobacteria bacterium]